MRKKYLLEESFDSLKVLKRLWFSLKKKSRTLVKVLIFFQILSGLLEMFSLFSIIPFITAITDTNILYKNKFTNNLIYYFGIENEKNLILITTIIFISFMIKTKKVEKPMNHCFY